ncbi:MAG: NAD(P)H-binding protein, partial [Armatimonadetes bacterium]|nr:NAD(P)H-binding protein [Armatimonadota bacterium]
MILVTGATGTVGRRVVELLAREGQQVRAMVRETEEAAAFEAMGVAALVGDVTRATDRAAALVNTDEVIACHSAYHDYSRPAIATVDGAATVDLIQDAAAAGVRHFTLLSHLGADRETLSQRFVAKRQAELALLGQPGMSFTILRAAPLMSELGRLPGLGAFQAPRSLLLFGSGESRVSPLSPADLALLASRAGRTEHARNETIAVGGPQVYSWRELGAVLERVEGERVRVWRLPRAILTALRWILGWIHPPAGDRLGYLEALYRQDFIGDPGRVGAIFGVGLEDFESWLRRAGGEAPSAPPDLSQERPPARHVEGAAPTRPLHEPGLETDEP